MTVEIVLQVKVKLTLIQIVEALQARRSHTVVHAQDHQAHHHQVELHGMVSRIRC